MRRLRLLLETIKFSHSVFALPFALAALWTAAGGFPGGKTLGLVLLCMVAARSAAMAFNRLADREFDARNPRTKNRPTVTGEVSPRFLVGFILCGVALFLCGAYLLNLTCFLLAPFALAVLLGYSYSKRFTSLSHFWLGLSLGLAPVGAHLAVRGDLRPLPRFMPGLWGLGKTLGVELFPLLLGTAVMLWTAGFDLIYSCQDIEADRSEARLFSLPKKLGVAGALRLSALLHAGAVLLFVAAGLHAGMGNWYFGLLSAVAGLLIVEHLLVKPNDLRRVNTAFFTFNGAVGVVFFAAVLLDLHL